MDAPQGFEDNFGAKVYRLKRSLYQLKQSPRAWSIQNQGYSKGEANHTLFIKHFRVGKIAILIIDMDDIILIESDEVGIARLKRSLVVEFEIKDFGFLQYFLGMEVARSKNGIFISQRKYVLDVLEETRMSGCELSDTPMEQNHKLRDRIEGVPVEVGRYQFMHLPYEEHLEAVY